MCVLCGVMVGITEIEENNAIHHKGRAALAEPWVFIIMPTVCGRAIAKSLVRQQIDLKPRCSALVKVQMNYLNWESVYE